MTYQQIFEGLARLKDNNLASSKFYFDALLYYIYGEPMLITALASKISPVKTTIHEILNDTNKYTIDGEIDYHKTVNNIKNYVKSREDTILFCLEENMIYFCDNFCINRNEYGDMTLYYKRNEYPEELYKFYEIVPNTKVINYLFRTNNGLRTHPVEVNFKTNNIDLNYNDDLPDDKIKEILLKKNSSELILFSGLPGTGKTSYIRHLVSTLPDLTFNVVGIDDFAEILNDKSSLSIIQDSVLIIEDCELLIKSRDSQGAMNELAGLLNMADGLFGDIAKCKIICTFNTNVTNIDSALLRKGRLSLRYDFKELTNEKRDKLCESLNVKCKSGLLSEIYNQESNGNEEITKKVGF